MHTIEEIKEDYDWKEVLDFAVDNMNTVRGQKVELTPFGFDDIKEILHIEDGMNDEEDWIAVFSLKDGRYVYVEAGCDYTGWDCQAGGRSWISKELNSLLLFGLGDKERIRFKIDITVLAEKVVENMDGNEKRHYLRDWYKIRDEWCHCVTDQWGNRYVNGVKQDD